MRNPDKTFKLRPFVAMVMVLSGLALPVTGIWPLLLVCMSTDPPALSA